MPNRIVCIAGGSGVGKSTLAEGLAAILGDRASLLTFDDYQKSKDQVPRTASGRPNYDHPDAIEFSRFLHDLTALRRGESILQTVKHKTKSMDGGVAVGRTVLLPARPLIIVEGYLALWHPDARALYDLSVFLDGDASLRLDRRRWAKDAEYVAEVLLPMHIAHVEPTKAFAHLLIDVSPLSKEDVLNRVLQALTNRGLIVV